MTKTNELKIAQKELIESFITDTDKISAVMSQYKKFSKEMEEAKFHKYSLRNFIFANEQLYQRTGNCCEILAPYKRWNKVNRNVSKGEKALWILAPINKKIGENDDGEPLYRTWFKRVPVFDLSQTEGERITDIFAEGNSKITWDKIMGKCTVPIIMTEQQLTQGSSNGEYIKISNQYNDNEKICILLHELAHHKLHFGKEKLPVKLQELEAETISFMCGKVLGIDNFGAKKYIEEYYDENPADEIKNRAGKLVKCSEEILNELGVI